MAIETGDATLKCGSITVIVDRIQPMLQTGSCVAFARVKFRTEVGSISIDNFRLLKGQKGDLWVAPPSHKKGEKFYDDVTVTEDLKKYLDGVVKKAYQEATRNG